jgi:hypothetical protein
MERIRLAVARGRPGAVAIVGVVVLVVFLLAVLYFWFMSTQLRPMP